MATISSQHGESSFMGVTFLTDAVEHSVSIPTSAYELEGFRAWALSEEFPEQGGVTFLSGGLIVEMSPEHFETHNFAKTEITATLYALVRKQKLGYFLSDRSLFSNETANVSTEPDGMFISHQNLKSGRCAFSASKTLQNASAEVVGSPDWVMEIVSPRSVKKDKVLLREGYFRAGVGEYWIIDALGDEIEFQMLVSGDKQYRNVEPQDGWLPSPTFGKSFRLERSKDQDGLLEYTLHMKSL